MPLNLIKFIYEIYNLKKHKKMNDLQKVYDNLDKDSKLKQIYALAKEKEAFKLLFNIYPKNKTHENLLYELYEEYIISSFTMPLILQNISKKDNKVHLEDFKFDFFSKNLPKIIGIFSFFIVLVGILDILGKDMHTFVKVTASTLFIFILIFLKPMLQILNYRWQNKTIHEKIKKYNIKDK